MDWVEAHTSKLIYEQLHPLGLQAFFWMTDYRAVERRPTALSQLLLGTINEFSKQKVPWGAPAARAAFYLTGHFVAFLFFHHLKVQDVLIPEWMKHFLLNGTPLSSTSHVLLENIPAGLNKTSLLVLTYFLLSEGVSKSWREGCPCAFVGKFWCPSVLS